MINPGAVLALFLVLPLSNALAAPSNWASSWAASPAPPQAAAPGVAARRIAPQFENQTLVQTIRLSGGGSRLRIRLSNEYGESPLVIGAAKLVLLDDAGTPIPSTYREITFGGGISTTIPPGAPMFSDPVAVNAKALSRVRISLFLPERTPVCTCHMVGGDLIQISPKGNYADRAFDPVQAPYLGYRAFISAVDVQTSHTGKVVVALGDSITDGYLSTPTANHRYPDQLAERLSNAEGGPQVSVVNAGISGNKLLSDPRIVSMGQSALARFDRDVLALSGVSHLVILIGINDIGGGGASPPTAVSLIQGYRQLIARAHAHDVAVIIGTIMPYEGAAYFLPQGDQIRQEVNNWIRTTQDHDGFIDFDAALRDPSRPQRLQPNLHSGDWLHPNDAGYRAMAEAIDLSLLQ